MAWCLIESDPGIFTELLEQIGVKEVQLEEIYDLSEQSFESLRPVYGLIFLFKWRAKERDTNPVEESGYESEVYFANQVIDNACATQAILSIVFNMDEDEMDIGDELRNFKQFTKDFSAPLKGLTLSNSEVLRKTHNSFARVSSDSFAMDLTSETRSGRSAGGESTADLYHFISYVPASGYLWELDGLKKGPVRHAPCTKDNWLETALPIIKERMDRYSKSEIRFNLMALIKERRAIVREQIADQTKLIDALFLAQKHIISEEQFEKIPFDPVATLAESFMHLPEDDVRRRINEALEVKKKLSESLKQEEEKLENYRLENIRRKHNYTPFLMEMLKILAAKGELGPLINKAKKK